MSRRSDIRDRIMKGKKKEDELVDLIESIGSNVNKLVAQTYTRAEPKAIKLLVAFGKWVERKLT